MKSVCKSERGRGKGREETRNRRKEESREGRKGREGRPEVSDVCEERETEIQVIFLV